MGNELQLQNIALQSMQGTNLQGIVQQQLGGIQIGNGFNIGNILAGIDDVENVKSGNPEQQASGLKNLLDKAVSIISKVCGSEAATAADETGKNAAATSKTNKEQEQQKSEITAGIEQYQNQINQESEVVQAAKGEIETATQKLEEAKKNIEEKNKSIEEKKEQLKTEKDPAKQKELLNGIQEDSNAIKASSDIITQAQEVIQCASQEVADSVAIMEEMNGGAFELQQEGEKNVAKLAGETTQHVQDNAQTQTKGTQNQITGEAAEQAAQTASSNMFTAALAPKLYRVAADQKQAGNTRQSGAAQNLGAIKQGIGGINDNVQLLNDFSTSIGGAFSQYADCVGDWNKALEPVITGFGTVMDNAETYGSSAEELAAASQNDISKIDGSGASSSKQQSSGEGVFKDDNKASTTSTENPQGQANEFEVHKVKTNFGV